MFRKILIANRGEIACRIIATARRMGIRTVAVHSDPDRHARHVALADEAYCLGGTRARESYLSIDGILRACRESGADALHPGYGFLSEDATFARRVRQAGLVFIGPGPEAIHQLGDKMRARRIAAQAGIDIVPGTDAPLADLRAALAAADAIGYPVMVKASAGGGGRGLRLARSALELEQVFEICRSEAMTGFGNDTVYLERLIEDARHVEIQVICDRHGNRITLGERECSIQRHHQKIIEECPSVAIDEAIRSRMSEQATALASAVGYESVGTVEFVLARDRKFYFLEFNTRLQVEHPVTECVTGIDLVEQMLRIAAGEALQFRQADVKRAGWAIECRINAEDPSRGFLPSSGRLTNFRLLPATLRAGFPSTDHGLRIDAGIAEGGEVSPYYDSMIAKLIVHGADRQDAIRRMRQALAGCVVRGVTTNVDFLSRLMAGQRFRDGDLSTSLIEDECGGDARSALSMHPDPDFLIALAAAVQTALPARADGRWRLNGHHVADAGLRPRDSLTEIGIEDQALAETIGPDDAVAPFCWHVEIEDERSQRYRGQVTVELRGADALIRVGAKCYALQLSGDWSLGVLRGRRDGHPFWVRVERLPLKYRIVQDGVRIEARVMAPRAAELFALMPPSARAAINPTLCSPMSGMLVELSVKAGQPVRKGDRLAVIEAMKMENLLVADRDGVIEETVARVGDNVAADEVILRFAAAAQPASS